MSTNRETDSRRDDADGPNGPGEGPMSGKWIVAVALYLVFISMLVLYGLIKLWPYPTPSGESSTRIERPAETSKPADTAPSDGVPATQTGSTASTAQPTTSSEAAGQSDAATAEPPPATSKETTAPAPSITSPPRKELPDPEIIYFFRGRLPAKIYLETRLLLLVMLAGALGSLMHALRSLYWYTGNRLMVWSWLGFYLLLPFTGAMLAVIFYFVVRGGFFSPQASFENTSPFGFAALSALVGLFSPQATLKLKEIAETIFTKPGAGTDTKQQASSAPAHATAGNPAPTVSSLSVGTGALAGGTTVVVAGTGFMAGAVVRFGTSSAQVTSVSNTAIEVITPAGSAAGPVDVEIINTDGQNATLAQGFTYT